MAREDGRADEMGDLQGARTAGTIARVLLDKGFGFIKASDGHEYFFHRSAVTDLPFEQLREGTPVTFEKGEGPKGPRAERVEAAHPGQDG